MTKNVDFSMIPAEIKIKIIRYLEGMNYTFSLLDYSYTDLYEVCLSINKDKSKIIPALSRCWQIIDMTHRIRELCQSTPCLNKDDRDVKSFLDNTKSAEEFRQYVQHLRQELPDLQDKQYPVFGSLSWVDSENDKKCYIAIVGTLLIEEAEKAGIQRVSSGTVYDTYENKFVSKVTLTLSSSHFNMSYNFDPIYDATVKFKQFIMQYLSEKIASMGIIDTSKIDEIDVVSAVIKKI